MRRILTLVVLLVGLGAASSCSAPASPPASVVPALSPNPGAAPPSADQVPQETESIYAGMFTPEQACRTADLTYAELDENWQEHIRTGTAAERRGDKEGVAKALAKLEPLFSSTAGTLADAAAKVADPVLREALNSLSDAAAESTLFTSFAQFQSLEARNAPAETTLKRECPKHGYSLKNIA